MDWIKGLEDFTKDLEKQQERFARQARAAQPSVDSDAWRDLFMNAAALIPPIDFNKALAMIPQNDHFAHERLQKFDGKWWVAPRGDRQIFAQSQRPLSVKGRNRSGPLSARFYTMVRCVQLVPSVLVKAAREMEIQEYAIVPWFNFWVDRKTGLPRSLFGFRRLRETRVIRDFKSVRDRAHDDPKVFWTGWGSGFFHSTLEQNLRFFMYEKWEGTYRQLQDPGRWSYPAQRDSHAVYLESNRRMVESGDARP